MNIFFHADDFGLTEGINAAILDAVDHGVLQSVSIIPNGYAFDEAILAYKKRPNLRIAIHLNLFEGAPLSKVEEVPLLVNRYGKLKHSFFSLWMKYFFSGSKGRVALQNQVRIEYEAQLSKVRDAIGNVEIRTDSHVHFHMIPFVFETLLSLRSKYHITSIRVPYEPWFVSICSVRDVWNYIGPNVIKHFLLKILSYRNQRYLHVKKKMYFLGILFSGHMTISAICAGLKKMPKDADVEILLHPGRAEYKEEGYWDDRPELKRYYRSVDRKEEGDVLQSSKIRTFLRSSL